MNQPSTTCKAAIYLQISQDHKMDGLVIERQVKER